MSIYKTLEHPKPAQTLFNIASQLSNMENYQKAQEKFEEVLGN